ncbi:DoxX family protein [Natrononativus amylolyticus]|uniref:DoxX family protein n=1 Tax=Natrononativus amylolyticus TaxID=2963434 RepID=UPI0020CC7452|nr:DoxX family protein [Natrononativus amylolyticus]
MIVDSPYFVAPFVLLIGALLAFRSLGYVGVRPMRSWKTASRYALAAMFVFTSISHFTSTRTDLVQMVPDVLPAPELLVTVTGVLELLGAIGLLWPRTARYAGIGLTALLVAMFPANVFAAQESLVIAGTEATPLWFRFLVQIAFIWLLLWATTGLKRHPSGNGADWRVSARQMRKRI